jgi:hypothetical protein
MSRILKDAEWLSKPERLLVNWGAIITIKSANFAGLSLNLWSGG